MAAVPKTITPSLVTKTCCNAHRRGPFYAGEDIAAGDACYLKSDGTVWRSIGTTLNAPEAKVAGWAALAAPAGTPVTLYLEVVLAYGAAGLVPGTRYFLSGTVAGGLDTAPSTGGTATICEVEPAPANTSPNHSFLRVFRSTY